MKKNMRRLLILALTIMIFVLSACASSKIIRQQTQEQSGMTAYLYTRKTDGQKEYCMSLLEKEETLDMAAEPNVYKSEYEFDFGWEDDMIMVYQHEEDEPMTDYLEFGDISVVFGQVYELE